MNKAKWIIHTSIIEGTSWENLPEVARSLGHEVFETKFDFNNRKLETPPFRTYKGDGNEDCVIVYGSLNYISSLAKEGYVFYPGAFGVTTDTACSFYMPLLPKERLLNSDYIFLPWRELRRSKDFVLNVFKGDVFVRPDSGYKPFTGFVLREDDWDYELNAQEQTSSVMHNSHILISSAKKIYAEYRFVIAGRKVVTGSQYHQNGETVESAILDPVAIELAEFVAKYPWWQLDVCYTCDIGITDAGPKIVEINSFSSAGLYKCDLEKVVTAVSKEAEQEVYGGID